MGGPYRVMISSTYIELIEHRLAIKDAMIGQDMLPVMMETDGSLNRDLIAESLEKVEKSDAYVGLVSYRYGQRPECKERNPLRLSLTELEFRRARERDIPILVFVLDLSHEFPANKPPEEPGTKRQLAKFRRLAMSNRICASFNSVSHLKEQAIWSLARLKNALDVGNHAIAGQPGITDILIEKPVANEVEIEDLLFYRYSDKVEKYYVKRWVDTTLEKLVDSATVWVSGPLGVGKTAAVMRALLQAHENLRYIALSPLLGGSVEALGSAMHREICRLLKVPPVNHGGSLADLIATITDALCGYEGKNRLSLIIEEVPIGTRDEFGKFLPLIYQCIYLYQMRTDNPKIRIALSSRQNPLPLISPGDGRMREMFHFMHLEPWHHDDIVMLITVIVQGLGIILPSLFEQQIVETARGSPRYVKTLFRNWALQSHMQLDELPVFIQRTDNEVER
jgi:hypothetical protein